MDNILYQKNIDINSKKTRQLLFEYIYKNVEIEAYDYHTISDLSHMLETEYFLQPLHFGADVFIVFIKFGDLFYSVYIKYLDLFKEEVIFTPLDVKINIGTYEGTIMRGTFESLTNSFHISDIYLLQGHNIMSHRIKHKFVNLKQYINTHFHPKNKYGFYLNEIYPLKQINTCLEEIKAQKKHIRGIMFSPTMTSVSEKHNIFIYLFEKNELNEVKKAVFGNKEKMFIMKKTNISDVYKLIDVITNEESVAYVATIEYSHLYKKWLTTHKSIKVYCQYNGKFKKWMPTTLID